MTQQLAKPFDADDASSLRVVGVIDAAAGERLAAVLAERIGLGELSEVRLDLSGAESIDAQGLVAIARLRQDTTATGRAFRVLDPSPAVGQLLALSGIEITLTS